MLSHVEGPFNIELSNLIIQKVMENPLIELETTSFDGKPFLNPFQLSSLQQDNIFTPSYKIPTKTPEAKISKTCLQYKPFLEQKSQSKISIKKELISNQCAIEKRLTKKVKTESPKKKEGMQSEASTMCSASPALSELDAKKLELFKEISEITIEDIVSEEKSSLITERPKKIISKMLTKKLTKLKFKVLRDEKEGDSIESLTREEVLKINPLLLIYFYEKHLKFSKTKDFNPKDLKKILN